ncbi:hypothetical protein ACFQH2_19470 [Natronoarchaeum sp. GCM10025703]|uniref:hypothetical protein n=1 Tax=unclassified Natronoarchaeum TaxID=2620183 RepID=UPI00361137C2
MGLKSGTEDAGLGEDSDDSEDDDSESEAVDEPIPNEYASDTSDATSAQDATPSGSSDPDNRLDRSSIPYTLRRENVNADREQVPFFLREQFTDAEEDALDKLEEELGEMVYKSDYREAAIAVAHEHPDLIASKLREWGYDL